MSINIEIIYKDFHAKLYRFIVGRISDPAAAEDILQEVYIKLHANIEGLRDENRLESWIYQITRHAIVDHYRKARSGEELSESLAYPIEDDPYALSVLSSSVQGMLSCLDPKYRDALVLTDLQGLSQVELASKLGITVSGAKSRVQRAREKLKEAFLDCCHFEFDRLGKVVDYHPNCEQCAQNDYPKGCSKSSIQDL